MRRNWRNDVRFRRGIKFPLRKELPLFREYPQHSRLHEHLPVAGAREDGNAPPQKNDQDFFRARSILERNLGGGGESFESIANGRCSSSESCRLAGMVSG